MCIHEQDMVVALHATVHPDYLIQSYNSIEVDPLPILPQAKQKQGFISVKRNGDTILFK